MDRFYPIGTPGKPWTDDDKAAWLQTQNVRRSYQQDVRDKLERTAPPFVVERYGALPIDPERYPLFVVKGPVVVGRPWALITGGVHGYETSGVQGALAFLDTAAIDYVDRVNLVVAPCVSPWGYEVIHRWNPRAVDPNRSFRETSDSEEAQALMAMLAALDVSNDAWLLHMDLHETTDSDEAEFRPALAARDGVAYTPGVIPDGFYTVGDADHPEPAFQAAVIAGVEQVTHIAPADGHGQIIGADVEQRGVIHYPCKALGLCAGVTSARFTTTTEVYPDSPKATPETCNAAQVAAVRAGLDYALAR